MKLKAFRVRNYRSISDSTCISVDSLTALVGRNESGKSNLLRALCSMNPSGGVEALDPVVNFPRDRPLDDCTDETPVVTSLWDLDQREQEEVCDLWRRATKISEVRIEMTYGGQRGVTPTGCDRRVDEEVLRDSVTRVAEEAGHRATESGQDDTSAIESALATLSDTLSRVGQPEQWAREAASALRELRGKLAEAGIQPTETLTDEAARLENLIGDVVGSSALTDWVLAKLPVFIYLDEYPRIEGRQNIAEYVNRSNAGQQSESDRRFAKMCRVAGLSPQRLHDLLHQRQPETRNQLANRASALVTKEIRRLWKDRKLKVRFDTDGDHLNTLVSDPNSLFDVEVNLDERSRGFQWFFSFYVTFAADTKDGDAENAMLLLDEPGLHLHARSQADLLDHLENDFHNQIIYTTHSPFMVPTHALETIRTVAISEEEGTTVSNDPTGDSRTLFPLRAALGFDLAQSLFIGHNNLVVEGITDYWALSSISEYLNDVDGCGLNADITITPAGGASKIAYMVALLSSHRLNVVALLDQEGSAKRTRDELLKSKMIRDKQVLFVSEAFGNGVVEEADMEDLLDPGVYEKLVRESYSKELEGTTLDLNANIPRVAKRFEYAFADAKLTFHKTRPMRLWLTQMGSAPRTLATEETVERFRRLFGNINRAFEDDRMRGALSLEG